MENIQVDLSQSDASADSSFSFDSDKERQNNPEHRYMRDLIYDAKKWKEAGKPEFEKRVLKTLNAFIAEYLKNLSKP